MAITQSDGISNVTNTSTDNNGGTIKANGSVAGTFQASSVNQQDVSVFGSTPVDNNVADKALSAGVFAYHNQKPVAKKLTNTLSTVNNDYLISGASDPSNIRSIHKIESIKTLKQTSAIRDGNFNVFTGKYDAGYPTVSNDVFYNISADDTSTLPVDDAANPTRDVPGEFVYRNGKPLPVQDDYKAKTN